MIEQMKLHIISKFFMKEQIKFKILMVNNNVKYLWDEFNITNIRISEGLDILQNNIITSYNRLHDDIVLTYKIMKMKEKAKYENMEKEADIRNYIK